MSYSIGEFSRLTGLSIHTLRYYEKEKLLNPARDKGGRRRYGKEDADWLAFVIRLKSTNMPIAKIRIYSDLRLQGSQTMAERREILQKHRNELYESINKLQENLSKLDEKIAYYDSAIEQVGG